VGSKTALGLGQIAPAPGESPATTEQVPVLLLEPRTPMMVVNPTTGEVAEGQVKAIIKAGLQRLTWPASLVQPAAGWTLQRTADGIELRYAHGSPWVRCAVMLKPRWVSAAVSWGQVLVLYGVRLGVRVPPNQGNRRYGLRQTCRAVCPLTAHNANNRIDTASTIGRTTPLQQAPR
jgi:hypothetical protein